ncbi:10086_t:CDS:2 [Acaulospora morrowiae]|uniref:10086_t:CDS:1 n=1 Tax=Acaulospora morrowiae TaxID=94023 RepID=A0A9N8VJN8_9GLOM|nr:10086_t:CDS:2 [Acaulospora morrowiae]
MIDEKNNNLIMKICDELDTKSNSDNSNPVECGSILRAML